MNRALHRAFGAGDVHAPLLDADELAALAQQAQHWQPPPALNEVHSHRAGDWPSTVPGRGLDFEELRAYQPGDALRDINWRATARRGQPYVRSYREERQPIWHLVLDRGASMRFGTRRRLKLTQAARLAVLLAHAALRRNAALGASLWDVRDLHLPAQHGEAALQRLLPLFVLPAPPLSARDAAEPRRLVERLVQLRSELAPGTRLWVLSDGEALDSGACAALGALTQWTQIDWWLIEDPAEQTLPDIGVRHFARPDAPTSRRIDTRDPAQREAFAAHWAARRAQREHCLRRGGIRPHRLSTLSDALHGEP